MANKTIALHGSSRGNNFGDVLLISIYKDWITEAGYSVILNNADKFCADYLQLEANVSTRECLRAADCLVLSGGGYFGEPNIPTWKWYLRLFKRHLLTAIRFKLHRKPYAIFGVEFGPISNWLLRRITVWVVNNARIVSVRNIESVNHLRKYGVSREVFMVPDSAFAVGLEGSKSKRAVCSERKKIVLHLVIDPDANYDINKKRLADFVMYLQDNIAADFAFMVDSGAGKNNIRYKFLQSLNEETGIHIEIKEYTNPKDTLDFILENDIVITTKLHVAITAYAMGRHVIGLSRHQKTKRFFNQVGLSDFHHELSELDENIFHLVVQQILNFQQPPTPSSQLISESLKNKDLLFDFLREQEKSQFKL